jgi:hypothetical protein
LVKGTEEKSSLNLPLDSYSSIWNSTSNGVASLTARKEAHWRWVVSWKAEHVGTVSTGTYNDIFERRDGIWKCLKRTSKTDPNWPEDLFKPFLDAADTTFKAS